MLCLVFTVSPTLTGLPTAPTAATADNSTLIANTAFVKAQKYITLNNSPVKMVCGRTGSIALTTVDIPDLALVAISDDYNDLINQPTKLSQFTNDVGFVTTSGVASLDTNGKLLTSQLP